ncbi:MAG: hypothetical protein VYE22_24205 [Myxococcota bacterium]|nr:hypothetical protein [Myxococcota bacterium]
MRASDDDATTSPVRSDPPTAPGWKSAALAIVWFLGFCAVDWTVGPRLAGHGLARWGNAPWPLALGAALAVLGLARREWRALLVAPAALPLAALVQETVRATLLDALPARLVAATRVPWIEACAFGVVISTAALVAGELRDSIRPRNRLDLLAPSVGVLACAASVLVQDLWLWCVPTTIGALVLRRREGWARATGVVAVSMLAPQIAAIARAAARTWGAINLPEARHQVLAEQFWPTHDLLWTAAAAALAGGAVTQLARRKELGHLFTILAAAAAWLAAWMLRAS